MLITSLDHLRRLAAELAPEKLKCELHLAGGRTTHLKVFWLDGRGRLMTRTPYGFAAAVAKTFIPTFIERKQLHILHITKEN